MCVRERVRVRVSVIVRIGTATREIPRSGMVLLKGLEAQGVGCRCGGLDRNWGLRFMWWWEMV